LFSTAFSTARAPALLLGALLLTPSSTTAQPPSRVTGQVIDGVTEAPLGDACVEGATDAVITESGGRFSIGVGADETTLRVQATGHLDTVSPELPQVFETASQRFPRIPTFGLRARF